MTHLRWPRRQDALPLLLVGGLLLGACGASAGAKSAATSQTSTVQRGTVETTINATGTVTAAGDLALVMESGGNIKEVLVRVGDRVAAGQPLIKADTTDLELELQQAEANLASAQAKYEQTKAGATEKDVQQAQAAVDQAQAKLDQTVKGTTTAQDITNAEAALRSAQAKLEATKAGAATQSDLANAEAALRSAQSKLAQVQAGAAPVDIASAQAALQQAKENRAQQESQLSLAKEQARLAIEAAANDLRSAQATYGAAKLIWDEADRTGKDPNIAEQKNPTSKGYRDLTDAKRRQYKNDYESAERAMTNAQQAMEQKQLAYEDAKKQEIAGLQTADSQIREAQAKLDDLTAGPDPQDVIQAQAAVDQAQANLDQLKAPAKETDVAQAQAAVDQARANLEKLQRPADPNDVAQSQAGLVSVQATLNDLKAGPKAADLAADLASVKQAEVARDQARSAVTKATLTAPFAGVVAAVDAVPGQPATADDSSTSTDTSTGLITLVDDSTLSIDVNIAESDIAKVAVGQPAKATFAALAGQTIPGKVTAVSPKATVSSNVVSYVATVALDGEANQCVKTGMTATVGVVIASKPDVLTVPNRVVQMQGQQKTVTVLFKGEQFSVPVQIGLVGDSVSEVVSGLQEGDVVVSAASTTRTTTTPNNTAIKPGGFRVPGGGG